MREPLAHDRVQQLIAVVDPARAVNHLDTVGIAVQCNTQVRLAFANLLDQAFRVQRTDILIDIEAVRRNANRGDFRTKLAKNVRRDVIRRAVGGIDHQLESAKIQVRWERALAKLDIPPGGIVNAPGPAQLFR